MIDPAKAKAALADIVTGEHTFVNVDGDRRYYRVVSYTDYSVTVIGLTGNITLPVNALCNYEKEEPTMAHQPLPQGGPRRPGRPRKAEAQAPVEHPSNVPGVPTQRPTPAQQPSPAGQQDAPFDPSKWAPQGTLAADVKMAEDSITGTVLLNAAGRATLTMLETAKPQTVTIQEAAGDPNWVRNAMDEILSEFRNNLADLLDRVTTLDDKVAAESATKTCADCQHSLISVNLCGKFNITPPMSVIVNAKELCGDFIDIDDEPPF